MIIRDIKRKVTFILEVGIFKWLLRYAMFQFTKRIFKKDPEIFINHNKFTCFIKSPTAAEIFVTNADMDYGTEKFIYNYLNNNSNIIDVGAHIGYYGSYLQNKISTIYNFEPASENNKFIKFNLKSIKKVEIENVFCGNENKNLKVRRDMHWANVLNSNDENKLYYEDIRMITLDKFFENIDVKIDFIKIDVDGYDFEVLIGSINLILKNRPLIAVECGEETQSKYTLKDWENLIKKINYTIKAFKQNRKLIKIINEDQIKITKMLLLMPKP